MSKPPVNQPAALAPAPVAAKSSATSLVFDCLRRCLTVRLRLIALLLLAAGMLAGLGYELLNGIEAMSRSVHSLATNHLPGVDLLGRARAGFLRAHLNERTLLFQSMSTPAAAATRADHTTAIAVVDDAWRQFTAAAPEIASGAGFAAPWREWCKVSAEVITILADDTPAARRDAIDLSTSVSKDAAAVVDQALDRAIAACSAAASAQAHSAAGAATAYQRDFYRQLGIGTGIVLLLGLVIVHSVVKPLRRMVRALHECAEGQGDLTQRLPPACGEIGSLAGSFNRFVDGLRTMVASMRTTALQVSTSSQDVTTVGQGLTTAAQSIESRLGIARSASQEVTAITAQAANSTRELSTSIHSIADSAQHLSGTAEDVGRVAVTTFNVVTEIGRDSHQVESIIGMIEAIARQTNLLALNASVEAARAGDAGAGFAVVAERVKALSIETSKATAEIRTLVGGFVGRVAATVDSIGKIKDAMVELQDRTNGIAAAVEEQSAVTREFAESFASIERASVSIAGELDAMDAVATESSRGAGAASTTATELDGASSHLSELVSRFKT